MTPPGRWNMRILGKRSVASFLKFLFDFVWYFAILIFSAVFVFFVYHFFIQGPSYEVHGWPIHVEPSVESFGIRPLDNSTDILEVRVDGAEIGFRTEGDWQPKALRMINLLVGAWLVLLIIYHLRRLMASVAKGTPFIRENVSRFRKAAILLLAIALFDAVRGIFIARYIRSRFSIDNPANPLHPLELRALGDFLQNLDGGLILLGLILLVLGEIFRIGLDYKEDSHSIV